MSTPLSQARTLPRLAEAAVERARLTVVPRRTQQAARIPFVSLVSLLLVGGIAGLLLFNTNMQQASFVATSMEEQAAVLAGKEESLRMQLHRLRDPQHVASRAKKLGMVPAGSPAFIRLSDGQVLGRPALGAPTDTLRITPLPPVKPESLRPRQIIAELPPAERTRAAEAAEAADTLAAVVSTSRDQVSSSRARHQRASNGAGQSRGRTP